MPEKDQIGKKREAKKDFSVNRLKTEKVEGKERWPISVDMEPEQFGRLSGFAQM